MWSTSTDKGEPTHPFPIQQLQVCAWRIKYYLELPGPLSAEGWQALRRHWPGSQLESVPLANGEILYRLSLPERKGVLSGSSAARGIYAVLARPEAQKLLTEVVSALASQAGASL